MRPNLVDAFRKHRAAVRAARGWAAEEREREAALQRTLDQAASLPDAEPRTFISASRDPDAPMLTPGQAARGHGGRQ